MLKITMLAKNLLQFFVQQGKIIMKYYYKVTTF